MADDGESGGKSDTSARQSDMEQQAAITESRVRQLAGQRSAATESGIIENSADNDNDPEENIGASRSQASNSNAAQLAEGAAKEIVKQQIKKLTIYNPAFWWWVGVGLLAALAALLVSFLIFASVMVYQCAQQKGTLGTLWSTSFGTDLAPLLQDAANGSCLPDTTPAPKAIDNSTPASTDSSGPVPASSQTGE